MPNDITVYVQPGCRYCDKAKALLRQKGQSFKEIDVTESSDLRQEMNDKSFGRNTTPQIFINGYHVGGCDDLYDLEQTGKLDGLLANK